MGRESEEGEAEDGLDGYKIQGPTPSPRTAIWPSPSTAWHDWCWTRAWADALAGWVGPARYGTVEEK